MVLLFSPQLYVQVPLWDPRKYIYMTTATRKIDLVMSVHLSVCHVQTTFLGHHNSYRLQILHSLCADRKLFNDLLITHPCPYQKNDDLVRNLKGVHLKQYQRVELKNKYPKRCVSLFQTKGIFYCKYCNS